MLQELFALLNDHTAVVFSHHSNMGPTHRNGQNIRHPEVCFILRHNPSLVKLVKIMVGFPAQSAEFAVGHCPKRQIGPSLHTDIGITGWVIPADIQHGISTVIFVDPFCASESCCASAVWTPGCLIPGMLLFLAVHRFSSTKDKKAALPQPIQERLPARTVENCLQNLQAGKRAIRDRYHNAKSVTIPQPTRVRQTTGALLSDRKPGRISLP